MVYGGFNVTNNFGVCTVQGSTIVWPAGGLTNRVNALIAAGQAPAGITSVTTNTGLTAAQISTNPFLIRSNTTVGHFIDDTKGNFIRTNVESFYVQDDFRFRKDVQFNVGLRWDFQQLYAAESSYLKLDSFKNNLQPRLGLIWDFTGKGKGKLFVNYARFLEAANPRELELFRWWRRCERRRKCPRRPAERAGRLQRHGGLPRRSDCGDTGWFEPEATNGE